MKIVGISRLVSSKGVGYKISVEMGWWLFQRVEHFIGEGTIWYNTRTKRQVGLELENFLSDMISFHEFEQEI